MAPLDGIRIIEFGGIGPGPFAGMLLADLGANVIRLHRHGEKSPVDIGGSGADHRSRPGIPVDLENPADMKLVLRLVDSADALIEGFRPGVMERLELGPANHPHHVARQAFVQREDGLLPASAPRFSSVKSAVRETPSLAQTLESWGLDDDAVTSMVASASASG